MEVLIIRNAGFRKEEKKINEEMNVVGAAVVVRYRWSISKAESY